MSNDILKDLGHSVSTLRIQKNWRIQKLAKKTNLKQNYLSEIEQGTRNVSIQTIGKIASGFGISIKELLETNNNLSKE